MKIKIIKNISVKIIILIVGVFISLSFYGVRAAWDSTVSSGQTLTQILWNDMVAKLSDLDNRVNTIETTGKAYQLLATASNWTEEARTYMYPNGTVSFTTDYGFGGQYVNVQNSGWDPNTHINEIIFEVENYEDDYCVGVNGTQNLSSSAGGTHPSCTRIYYQGVTPTSSTVVQNDWITLWVNGTRQLGCQGGGYHHPRFGARCSYPINGLVSNLRVDEVDWSADYGTWKWKIWYR